MKQLVYSLLIISLFASNVAWAWDNHPEILTGHVTGETELLVLNGNTDSGDQGQHDHNCCCGYAHIVAIRVSMPAFDASRIAGSYFHYRSTFLEHIPQLLNKPPKA